LNIWNYNWSPGSTLLHWLMESAFCVESVKSPFLSSPNWSMEYAKFVSICWKILSFNLYLASPLWIVELLGLYPTCINNGHKKKYWWWWWLRIFLSCLIFHSPPVLVYVRQPKMPVTRKSHQVIYSTNIWVRIWLEGNTKYVNLKKMWIL
jgi:hypothetical protein